MTADPVKHPAATRVVLLDRDGTIIEDPGYLADPDAMRFLPGALDGLARLAAAGYRLVVVTNQSGVGRGMLTEAQVTAVHRRLREELGRHGVRLSGIYHCPHRPEDGCDCRKPGTALVERAARELEFDPADAVVVGDKPSDMALAQALGIPGILVLTGSGGDSAEADPELGDYVARDLVEVAGIVSGHPMTARKAR